MTAQRLSLIALAFAALLAPRALAREPQTVTVGETSKGEVSLDLDSVIARGGVKSGWRTVKADIQLAKPFHYAAHEVTRETQTQDWDCKGRRYRVVVRSYFTSTGLFVYSTRGRESWQSVPEEGSGSEQTTFATLCPS